MKYGLLIIALATPLRAELLATVQTSEGNVSVALQYEMAPQAVANFITLAQGTRKHIDPLTGTVTNKPFYIGEKFFRVINDSNFKIAQTGSGTGSNSGGPGYSFMDEFDPSLTHSSYVLSMANSGPQSNGSQIFFSGNTSIPWLDNVHTVFGLIEDPASQAVIDSILAAGNDGTTITGVTFERTDSAAQEFDEHAQNLPDCTGIAGSLSVNRGVATHYNLAAPQAPSTVFQTFRSADLKSWGKLNEIYQATDTIGSTQITLDDASLASAFFNLSLVTYHDALSPSSLANRILVMGLFADKTLTFHFNATGDGGTAVYSETPDSPATITWMSYSPSPHSATFIIDTDAYQAFRIIGSFSSTTATQIIGTNTSEQWDGITWNSLSSGSLSLSN